MAQDLGERRDRVTQQIDRGRAQLDQSSARLAAATRGLQEAEEKLGIARDTLARTRGELAAAVALDNQMQAELAEAERDLERARKELADTRRRVRQQEDLLGQIAVTSYETGDPALLGLSMVLTTQDTEELTSQLGSVRSLLDKESVTLGRLEASRVILTGREAAFEKAEREVARQREAAADNLERKASLEAQAEEAQVRIEDLVEVRSQARETAATARAEDLRQLEALEDERDRISELLRQRAEEARRRAAAAAAARAAAREAAREAREAARAREAREAARARAAARPDVAPAPAPAPVGLLYPVDGYITSSYGMRFHPVYRRWSLHDGTDFGASCGTPVRAATSGTVVSTYYHSAYGNRVIIDHGYRRGVGLATAYNHLSGYSTYVGQRVQRGEIIGYVGTTGASTGCHLHFMVFENGATVDPMTWL